MKDFKNKVAAITGAGSGMGRSLALALAREGCQLALSDRNEKGLAQTVPRSCAQRQAWCSRSTAWMYRTAPRCTPGPNRPRARTGAST